MVQFFINEVDGVLLYYQIINGSPFEIDGEGPPLENLIPGQYDENLNPVQEDETI